jgi:hypothetical protein
MSGARPALGGVAFLAFAMRAGAPPGVTWEGADSPRRAEWAQRIESLATAHRGASLPILVKVAPDLQSQAGEDGDTAFATCAIRHHRVEIHVAADAPANPDMVSPVLGKAQLLAEYPSADRFPTLAAAYGAHRAGAWWGKPVAGWAPMLRAADLLPDAAEICRPLGKGGPPSLLDVGAASSAIDLWARIEGEAAVERALGSGEPPVEKIRDLLASAARAPGTPPARRPLPAGFLRGVSFAMENSVEGSYLSLRSAATLVRLKGNGANAVSLMPYAFELRARAPELRLPGRNPRGETEEGVLRAAEDAHGRGMAVLIKPQIWLWRGFTGDIAMTSESDWAAWFRGYRAYLLRYGVVAEAAGAEFFDIGVELCATERREREWRELIRAVRGATGAPLVYSCNWGKGADSVPFWDALDAIGVDFYDPLSRHENPTDADLAAGVRAAAQPLAVLATRSRKPVYLTEVGFPSVSGAWLSPNEEISPRPFSASDSARCARAVFAALDDAPWCRGLFWWKAFSDGHDAGASSKTFNILGRPIEGAIREGFLRIAERGRERENER